MSYEPIYARALEDHTKEEEEIEKTLEEDQQTQDIAQDVIYLKGHSKIKSLVIYHKG